LETFAKYLGKVPEKMQKIIKKQMKRIRVNQIPPKEPLDLELET
jgi:hypothetical protein